MACKPVGATALKWHKILGHAGPDTIEQLPKHVNGAELTELAEERAPLKIKCKICSIAKHTQQISRRRQYEFPATRPFERLAFDIIDLGGPGYNGDRYVMHFYCTCSKFNFVYTAKNKDKATVLPTIYKTHRLIKIQFHQDIIFFWSDDERAFEQTEDTLQTWCADKGITFECRAPYTEEQNGGVKRSGRTLMERSRAIQLKASLPPSLGLEAFLAAGYALNRTPNEQLGWKTPYKIAYGKPPSLTHMHVYGCKTYTLDKRIKKGDKLAPRALIGHLVGYDSTNIYRIWIPSLHKVI